MRIQLNQPLAIHELGNRSNQEDCIFPALGKASEDNRLFIVCDGMGGHEKGEVASTTVCQAVASYIDSHYQAGTVLQDSTLKQAVMYALDQLDTISETGTGVKKMGTTLTLIAFHRGGCTMAHIGDSRIYHIRPEERRLLYKTRDHSLVYDLFLSGEITMEEMRTHPKKNVITRALMPDSERPVNASIAHTTDLRAGDYLYLCSDGMLEEMDDEELLGILCTQKTNTEKRDMLIARTMDNKDNHSAYLIQVASVENEDNDNGYANDEASARFNAALLERQASAPKPQPTKKAEHLLERLRRLLKGKGLTT